MASLCMWCTSIMHHDTRPPIRIAVVTWLKRKYNKCVHLRARQIQVSSRGVSRTKAEWSPQDKLVGPTQCGIERQVPRPRRPPSPPPRRACPASRLSRLWGGHDCCLPGCTHDRRGRPRSSPCAQGTSSRCRWCACSAARAPAASSGAGAFRGSSSRARRSSTCARCRRPAARAAAALRAERRRAHVFGRARRDAHGDVREVRRGGESARLCMDQVWMCRARGALMRMHNFSACFE